MPTTVSKKFKRTATGKFEVFKPVITLTPRQREVFLRDQSKYLRNLFEKRGHKVNGFYVSSAAERNARKILDTFPKGDDAQFIEIIVHVVSGGGLASTYH